MILRSSCDVIDDLITMKIFFLHNFVGIVTGIWAPYQKSQEHTLHFELLIGVLAKKLTELLQFQNLTYFVTSWPSYLTYDLEKL